MWAEIREEESASWLPHPGESVSPSQREVAFAEYAVLAAMADDEDTARSLVCSIMPEHFDDEENREIFQSYVNVHDAQKTPNIVNVILDLRLRGKLAERLGRILWEFAMVPAKGLREAMQYAETLIRARKDRHIRDLVAQLVQDGATAETIRRSVDEAHDRLGSQDPIRPTLLREDAALAVEQFGEEGGNRIATGFAGLDLAVGSGFERGELVVVGARPGMGKTTFALNMLAAMKRYPSALYSMEMTREKIGIAAAQIIGTTRIADIRQFGEERFEFARDLRNYETLKVHTLYPAILTPMQAAASIRHLVRQHGVRFVVIDNLSLMTDPDARRHGRVQEVSTITRALKALAMELEITVMVLAQLNRQAEAREDSRPVLTDLRDSGSIEQDADVVSFLWRPSYQKSGRPDPSEQTEFIVRKSRGRDLSTVKFYFDPDKLLYTLAAEY